MFVPDPNFSIQDPNFFHLGFRIRIKEFRYFNPNCVLSSRKYDLGCSSWTRILIFTHPGRGQKGPGSGTQHWPSQFTFYFLQLRARRSGGSMSRRIRVEPEVAGGPRRTNARIWLYSACPGRPRSKSSGSTLSLLERSSWPRFVSTPLWNFLLDTEFPEVEDSD